MTESAYIEPNIGMVKHLCRICSTDSDVQCSLIANNELTSIGEMFQNCLHINVLSNCAYPDKICNYCQLQLNMFHAFMLKATKSHEIFTELLEEIPEYIDPDVAQECSIKAELENSTMTEITNDIEDDDQCEFEIKYDTMDSSMDEEYVASNEELASEYETQQDDYNVEYLEPEYINSFENELESNKASESPQKPVMKSNRKRNAQSSHEQKCQKRKAPNKSKSTQRRKYPYECKECQRGFLHEATYDGHMRSVHEGLPAFSCPHCPKTFNEKPNFDYHMQDHTNHRPAQCDLCDKSFKNKQDLNSHLRVHNDVRNYMCDVCGKKFRSQSHMVYHRYSHFEERNFHCDECTQTFKSPHILKTHKNTIHSTIFRYECGICGKKFKRDHHLVAHNRTHSKDRTKKVRRTKVSKENTELKEEIILTLPE